MSSGPAVAQRSTGARMDRSIRYTGRAPPGVRRPPAALADRQRHAQMKRVGSRRIEAINADPPYGRQPPGDTSQPILRISSQGYRSVGRQRKVWSDLRILPFPADNTPSARIIVDTISGKAWQAHYVGAHSIESPPAKAGKPISSRRAATRSVMRATRSSTPIPTRSGRPRSRTGIPTACARRIA